MTPGELEHLAGRRLGHYHLQTLLGARGQVAVYRALDLSAGREIALYVIAPSETVTFGERFRSAVARITGLMDAHILPVYELGQDEDFSFVAVPIEREFLRDRLRREGVLPPVEAARLIAQVAWALHALHNIGISGLRLSLDNILLSEEGLALLADTSVAHGGPTDALVPRVATGLPLGVVQAMAHGSGAYSEENERVDVYALGIALYELLTGAPPDDNSTQEALASGMLTALLPEKPRTTRLWPELEEVVLNTLAADPRRRYPDARSFAVAIRHAVARYDDGGASEAPIPTLLKVRRTNSPVVRGDAGELQAKLYGPGSPPALPRPRQPSRPVIPPPAPPAPSVPPALDADGLPPTTLLPGRTEARQPSPSRPIRPTSPPIQEDSDEDLRRILHGSTGAPTPSTPRRLTGSPPSRPSAVRRTGGPSLPPALGATRLSQTGGPSLPERLSRPAASSFASHPSIPPSDDVGQQPRADAQRLYSRTSWPSRPVSERPVQASYQPAASQVSQPSSALETALSLRELANSYPDPPRRRARARLLLASLLGIALVFFCVTGLLAIATGQAHSNQAPAAHSTPTATSQAVGGTSIAVASATTVHNQKPNATHNVPTPTPTPKPTPTSTPKPPTPIQTP